MTDWSLRRDTGRVPDGWGPEFLRPVEVWTTQDGSQLVMGLPIACGTSQRGNDATAGQRAGGRGFWCPSWWSAACPTTAVTSVRARPPTCLPTPDESTYRHILHDPAHDRRTRLCGCGGTVRIVDDYIAFQEWDYEVVLLRDGAMRSPTPVPVGSTLRGCGRTLSGTRVTSS